MGERRNSVARLSRDLRLVPITGGGGSVQLAGLSHRQRRWGGKKGGGEREERGMMGEGFLVFFFRGGSRLGLLFKWEWTWRQTRKRVRQRLREREREDT